MGVITENDTSQNNTSSPAQIWGDCLELASVIFGSNSEARVWAAKYVDFNGSGVATELCGFNSCAPGVETHTHTHTHTLQ